MKKIDFRDQSGLTTNVLAKLGKDEHVSTQTLEKYVNCLNAKLEIFWSMFQMKVGIHKWDRM
jgi:DNA-binding Xre family transcriptional regulator